MGSSAEMPFLDHLEELRWRIIWSLAALVVGVVVGFVIVIKFNLLVWMQGPIAAVPARPPPDEHASRRRLLDHDADGDHHRHRARAARRSSTRSGCSCRRRCTGTRRRSSCRSSSARSLLFVAGAALAWYFVLPMTLRFLTSHGRRGVRPDDLGDGVLRLRHEPRAGDGRGVRAADPHPRALGARAS